MMGIDRDVGKLEARMETVEAELLAMRADVREIRDALVGARTSWLVLSSAVAFSTACGAIASAVAGAILPGVLPAIMPGVFGQ